MVFKGLVGAAAFSLSLASVGAFAPGQGSVRSQVCTVIAQVLSKFSNFMCSNEFLESIANTSGFEHGS